MTADSRPTVRRRCYLVRHGQVDYFDDQGRPLDPRGVSLSRTGTHQARALGQVLQGVRLDRALCSDYPRARQTLDLVLMERDMPIESLPELREIRAGRLREIPREELRDRVLGTYRSAGDPGASFLGGERWDAFQARVLSRFLELLQDPGWEHLLIVSHDAVNRILLGWATGVGLSGIAAFEQDNACLNVVDIDMQDCQVVGAMVRLLNFTPYDPHKAGIHETVLEHLFSAIQPDGLKA